MAIFQSISWQMIGSGILGIDICLGFIICELELNLRYLKSFALF